MARRALRGLLAAGLLPLLAPAVHAAKITVNTIDVSGDGNCTLPEAVDAANTDSAVDACAAGSGDDEIDLTGLSGTIVLAQGLLITSNVVIRGPGARALEISGSGLASSIQMIRNDSGAVVTIEDVTIRDKAGTGIFASCLLPCQGQLVLDRVRVTHCHSDFDPVFMEAGTGGALSTNCTEADVTIRDSLFDGNATTAAGSAGGAIWWAGRDLTIVNSTFSGNGTDGTGGALWLAPYVAGGGETLLRNVTFSGNAAAAGGAVAVVAGTNTIENSALASSPSGGNCSVSGGTLASGGHNVSDDGSCVLQGAGDVTGVAAGLSPLGAHGGPTDTHVPGPGSPLRDGGDPAGCTDEDGQPLLADQRGFVRPGGAACDVGAVEGDSACRPEPLPACRTAEKAQVRIAAGADPARRQVRWSWKKGDAVTAEDLADPAATTSFGFCVFDHVDGAPSLALMTEIDPGGAWQEAGAKGIRYRDKAGTDGGVVSVVLKPGAAGKASAQLVSRGSHVPAIVPNDASELFDQDPAVTVQLVNDAGACWTSDFAPLGTRRNGDGQFQAKSP